MSQPPLKATIIPVTPLQQNCTLFWCTRTMRAAVVDPGGDLPRIKAAIAEAGVTVEKILITHGHADHCGEAGVLAKELSVPIEGPHEADRYWLARLEDDCRKWGLRGEAFEPDRWLDDGEQVTVGNLVLDVYLCPGHTPGHVVFHHPPSKLAIVGDVIFQGSVGRTDFPLSDPDALVTSIVTKLWPLGDDTVFLPGHGGVSSFGRERASNPFVGDAALARG
ncbi:MBL fold metallo-hydrolase [Sphingomonas donggukensis]|uniref:MBL fold metallo-hydrolase n=1 Tax=Sphingomonas donggukensis TaxID=2949093 RepID=A0ABY4TS86_9SPHN|nr:MBL fold metallo-hydrolase [Sphingomonas donggukensis]URW75245.1 MBL fold metallo-hydrolase [Sphingomonas donggukensis]